MPRRTSGKPPSTAFFTKLDPRGKLVSESFVALAGKHRERMTAVNGCASWKNHIVVVGCVGPDDLGKFDFDYWVRLLDNDGKLIWERILNPSKSNPLVAFEGLSIAQYGDRIVFSGTDNTGTDVFSLSASGDLISTYSTQGRYLLVQNEDPWGSIHLYGSYFSGKEITSNLLTLDAALVETGRSRSIDHDVFSARSVFRTPDGSLVAFGSDRIRQPTIPVAAVRHLSADLGSQTIAEIPGVPDSFDDGDIRAATRSPRYPDFGIAMPVVSRHQHHGFSIYGITVK
jgi:hypothetical protein